MNKLELLSYPLPEVVENMPAAGAEKLIAKYLEKKETPEEVMNLL